METELNGETTQSELAVVSKVIGTEWCRTTSYVEWQGKPFGQFIALEVDSCWIILCNVIQDMSTGVITRVPIRTSELNSVSFY